MSLEENIADLTTQAGLLLDLPQDIADIATSQINDIGNAYQNHLDTLSLKLYVSQIGGDNAANGDIDNPLATIAEAISRVPMGGTAVIYVDGNYNNEDNILIDSKHIRVQQKQTTRFDLTFERGLTGAGDVSRRLYAFELRNHGSVHVTGFHLHMPVLDGTYAAKSEVGLSSMFASSSSSHAGPRMVGISYCDIDMPAVPFSSIVGFEPVILYATSLTITDQALEGTWIRGETNGAGVDPATLGGVLSNLSLV